MNTAQDQQSRAEFEAIYRSDAFQGGIPYGSSKEVAYAVWQAARALPAAEPVAGQCRFVGEAAWLGCAAEHVRAVLAAPQDWEGYEVRYLYAADRQVPAAPEVATGPCGQCKDARQPCQGALDTILKERGLLAVSRESFQQMVTKIAAASAPACWCECCDTVAHSGFRSRMSLCPQCGDKRCPRAYHHNSDCSAP